MRLQATRTFTVQRTLPAALEGLERLARNYHWSWNTETAVLFERLDPGLWGATQHNPVRLLQQVNQAALDRAAADSDYLGEIQHRLAEFERYSARPRSLAGVRLDPREVVAYFSFEFAITESLPSYSGGLGVLAGDHLKSASDLGLPLVGVGLFYRQGYFHQWLTADGSQTEEYTAIDPAFHAMTLVRDDGGSPLTVTVPFPGRNVACGVWRVDVGLTPLYLLDTEVDENSPEDRKIAARLYGGDIETRIQQEMLLGIGGVRLLRALGLRPVVCHMNEGHSSLLALERIRELQGDSGLAFAEARFPVTAATAFTTHTPVAAGIDLFAPDLVRSYLDGYYQSLGLDDRALLGLGRMHPGDDHEPFSMALLGLRLSGFRNGVSKLHGDVSRSLWAGAWPVLPEGQAPIASVTNGVHLPTWVAHDIASLFDRTLGRQWRDDPVNGTDWRAVEQIPSDTMWEAHSEQRARLVRRAAAQHRESSARTSQHPVGALDPDALTIGFARRFAAYKRATLLFRDIDRLAAIVNNANRPVQFLFAGKAHPRDEAAKQLIREVVQACRRPELKGRLVVLEHYDVDLARALVQGCDVWLNTPLRPLEASGTSGMKAVANGGLHMSVRDGWWAEAYREGLGWAIGHGRIDESAEVQDAFDSESIYRLLEDEVVPLFYERDTAGIPHEWVRRMKRSIAAYAPVFSSHRMVMEYAERAYVPGVAAWRTFEESGMRRAVELAGWLAHARDQWHTIKILSVEDDGPDPARTGAPFTVTVQAHWGGLSHDDVQVDAVCGPANPEGELVAAATTRMRLEAVGQDGTCRYVATVAPATGGRSGYGIRVTPHNPALTDAADTGLALWA